MSDDTHSDHSDENHEPGHGRQWGDYNAEATAPSTLPHIGPFALLVFGLALMALLGTIAFNSLEIGSGKSFRHGSPGKHAPTDAH